ncbi:MAG: class I SAM-dependent methyltransferase [Vampirovibrionales bacterium]|nr:class I SAM-dependent methyltransferase [Vampirovibrionales bacterium]
MSDVRPAEAQTEALASLAAAERYNRWIFRSFERYLGERTLEVGCGVGNFTRLLLERASHVTALDIAPEYVAQTLARVTPPPGKSLEALTVNLFSREDDEPHAWHPPLFDSIVMLNVLEHLRHDRLAVSRLRDRLKPGGRLIIFVPALRFLYSRFDRSIRHYRRYDRRRLMETLTSQGLEVLETRAFNLAGAPAWWLQFKLLGKTRMEAGPVKLFDRLTPIFQWMEDRIAPPIGLSLLAIARRPAE